MTTATIEKPAKVAMNGVDVPTFVATLGAVSETPAIASFTFRAKGAWQGGTHSRTTFTDYFGATAEQQHVQPHTIDGDHPTVLCGTDKGVTPVEMVLAALSACITAGIGNIASIRQVKLESVESSVEGDIDLNGILGLDDGVRNGFAGIRATFRIKGDAPAEVLEQIVQQSIARSAVFDIITNGVPVTVTPEAA
jgi:uncharacterized OsmC-like protein